MKILLLVVLQTFACTKIKEKLLSFGIEFLVHKTYYKKEILKEGLIKPGRTTGLKNFNYKEKPHAQNNVYFSFSNEELEEYYKEKMDNRQSLYFDLNLVDEKPLDFHLSYHWLYGEFHPQYSVLRSDEESFLRLSEKLYNPHFNLIDQNEVVFPRIVDLKYLLPKD